VAIARSLSDSFTGITPASVLPFAVAQAAGAALAWSAIRVLWPNAEELTEVGQRAGTRLTSGLA
jgi:glycerol uptake facilitator-like aquaporin